MTTWEGSSTVSARRIYKTWTFRTHPGDHDIGLYERPYMVRGRIVLGVPGKEIILTLEELKILGQIATEAAEWIEGLATMDGLEKVVP